jgi:hypothetical protein
MLTADGLQSVVATTGISRETGRDPLATIASTFAYRLATMRKQSRAINRNSSTEDGDIGFDYVKAAGLAVIQAAG